MPEQAPGRAIQEERIPVITRTHALHGTAQPLCYQQVRAFVPSEIIILRPPGVHKIYGFVRR